MTNLAAARAATPRSSRTIVVAMTALVALLLGTIGAAATQSGLPDNPAPAGTYPLVSPTDLELNCDPASPGPGDVFTCTTTLVEDAEGLYAFLTVLPPVPEGIPTFVDGDVSIDGFDVTLTFLVPTEAEPGQPYLVRFSTDPDVTSCYAAFDFWADILHPVPLNDVNGVSPADLDDGLLDEDDDWPDDDDIPEQERLQYLLAGPGSLRLLGGGEFAIEVDGHELGRWVEGEWYEIGDLVDDTDLDPNDEVIVDWYCDGGQMAVAEGVLGLTTAPPDAPPIVDQPTTVVTGPSEEPTEPDDEEVAVDDTAAEATATGPKLPETGVDSALLALFGVLALLGGVALTRRPQAVGRS